MERINKKPKFLSFETINKLAKDFLCEHNCQDEIPIPIEKIVEDLGFDIIPSFQLTYRLGIEAFIMRLVSNVIASVSEAISV